jgi:hypothetical protein
MVIYKGMKAFYLGLKRWRINAGLITFDVICNDGIRGLLNRIDKWEAMAYELCKS